MSWECMGESWENQKEMEKVKQNLRTSVEIQKSSWLSRIFNSRDLKTPISLHAAVRVLNLSQRLR